jgi:hypothetical protein
MGKRFVSRSNEPLWANLYTRGKDLSGIGGKVTLTPTPYKPPNQFGAWSIRTYRPFHSKEEKFAGDRTRILQGVFYESRCIS